MYACIYVCVYIHIYTQYIYIYYIILYILYIYTLIYTVALARLGVRRGRGDEQDVLLPRGRPVFYALTGSCHILPFQPIL